MTKVIGFDESVYKKFVCSTCAAIVQYAPSEDKYTNCTDEDTRIKGLKCPNCHVFHRTNP